MEDEGVGGKGGRAELDQLDITVIHLTPLVRLSVSEMVKNLEGHLQREL